MLELVWQSARWIHLLTRWSATEGNGLDPPGPAHPAPLDNRPLTMATRAHSHTTKTSAALPFPSADLSHVIAPRYHGITPAFWGIKPSAWMAATLLSHKPIRWKDTCWGDPTSMKGESYDVVFYWLIMTADIIKQIRQQIVLISLRNMFTSDWIYLHLRYLAIFHCHHLAEDIANYIFLNEYSCNLIQIALNFVPKGLIDCANIGSGNGLVLNRRQAITRINDDSF